MKKIPAFIAMIILATSFYFDFPDHVIHGKVVNESNEPVPFANVVVRNSFLGAVTDEAGNFQITIPDSTIELFVTMIGYLQSNVIINRGQDSVRVVLQYGVIELDDVTIKADHAEEISYDVIKAAPAVSYDYAPALSGASVYSSPAYTDGVSMHSSSGKAFYKSEVTTSGSAATYYDPNAQFGVLTAGVINDFGKWKLWKDIEEKDLSEWKKAWNIQPENRYSIQLETESGMPVIDAEVELKNNSGKTIWKAHTDNTGKAELWADMFSNDDGNKKLKLNIHYNHSDFQIADAKEFHQGINILKIPVDCNVPAAVDVAFVIDATSSMGDEISYLQAELKNIIEKIKDALAQDDLHLGCVFYRDRGDEYLTKTSDLTSDIPTVLNFIAGNSAGGGGDFPEAVDEALKVGISDLSWRKEAITRIMFLVLDAPPHQTPEVKSRVEEMISLAAEKGVRIVPVTCSGIDKSTEYLLRSAALATNGNYIFLTDHSGVGNAHIAPTTDKYEVEKLNAILYRTIMNFSHATPCGQMPVLTASTDTLLVVNPLMQVDTSAMISDSSSTSVSDSLPAVATIRWKYFPNPTDGIVHVISDSKLNELYVMDLNGKLVQRFVLKDEKTITLDLTPYAAGTYYIEYEYAPDKFMKGKVVLVH